MLKRHLISGYYTKYNKSIFMKYMIAFKRDFEAGIT
jgi:hypothetical protein